ncbi:MAG TPA: peptidylprolyl isomerase [Burkholderiaceae bacterium]
MKFIQRFALAASLVSLTFLSACGGGGDSSGGSSSGGTGGSTVTPPVTLTVTHTVTMVTSMGTIVIGLDRTHAPKTVDNFLAYVNSGFYSGTLFHRVISNFVVQGGGFTRSSGGVLTQKATSPAIALESNTGLQNLRGTIAMARTSVPDSATSQFYINVVDNASLNYASDNNPGYAVFGKVTSGMDVVDAIRVVATTGAAGNDAPLADVTITEVKEVK